MIGSRPARADDPDNRPAHLLPFAKLGRASARIPQQIERMAENPAVRESPRGVGVLGLLIARRQHARSVVCPHSIDTTCRRDYPGDLSVGVTIANGVLCWPIMWHEAVGSRRRAPVSRVPLTLENSLFVLPKHRSSHDQSTTGRAHSKPSGPYGLAQRAESRAHRGQVRVLNLRSSIPAPRSSSTTAKCGRVQLPPHNLAGDGGSGPLSWLAARHGETAIRRSTDSSP